LSVEITSFSIALISVTISVISFLYQRLKSNVDTENRFTKMESKGIQNTEYILELRNSVSDLVKKLDLVSDKVNIIEVKNEVLWNSVEKAMIDVLHHPTEYKRDELLEKLEAKTITLSELEELKCMLTDIIKNNKNSNEVIAAVLLSARVSQIILDAKLCKEIGDKLSGCRS
jgi:hypothetical protein